MHDRRASIVRGITALIAWWCAIGLIGCDVEGEGSKEVVPHDDTPCDNCETPRQEYFDITIVVLRNFDGSPIPGARVGAWLGSRFEDGFTDSQGRFVISNVPRPTGPDDYVRSRYLLSVDVSVPGFRRASVDHEVVRTGDLQIFPTVVIYLSSE